MSSPKFLAVAGALLLLAAPLAGCGSKKATTTDLPSISTSTTSTTGAGQVEHGCTVVEKPPKSGLTEKAPTGSLDPKKQYDVTLQTNCGSFTFRIDQAQSPNDSNSFVYLVQKGFFDHTIFHRIAPGFVIQGGDPSQTNSGGPGYQTVDPPPATATYPVGTVAMAKTQLDPPGTAGSQFFVVTSAAGGQELTADYAIIGKVTKGLNVVLRIGRLGNSDQSPSMVVEIEKATVTAS